MRKLCLKFLLLPYAVFMARVEVTPVPMPQDIDTEVVVTNLRGTQLVVTLLDGVIINVLVGTFNSGNEWTTNLLSTNELAS